MRRNNAMSSPAWQKQMNALLITLHNFLPRGTLSDLTDPPPSRNSTWSIRSPGRAPPPELLHRSDHSQREYFFRLWNTVSPPHSSDRFRAGRGLLGPHCPRRSLYNTHHFRGRLLIVQIGLRLMFPTSVRNQGTSRDSPDSFAPLQT